MENNKFEFTRKKIFLIIGCLMLITVIIGVCSFSYVNHQLEEKDRLEQEHIARDPFKDVKLYYYNSRNVGASKTYIDLDALKSSEGVTLYAPNYEEWIWTWFIEGSFDEYVSITSLSYTVTIDTSGTYGYIGLGEDPNKSDKTILLTANQPSTITLPSYYGKNPDAFLSMSTVIDSNGNVAPWYTKLTISNLTYDYKFTN